MNFEWIPAQVYLISAVYRPPEGTSYRSFMMSALRRDEEFWLHIEYEPDAAQQTLALLQETLTRLERHDWQWPDQVHAISAEMLVEMAHEAPAHLPGVAGYVHSMRESQWPRGRGEFVYWENVWQQRYPAFG